MANFSRRNMALSNRTMVIVLAFFLVGFAAANTLPAKIDNEADLLELPDLHFNETAVDYNYRDLQLIQRNVGRAVSAMMGQISNAKQAVKQKLTCKGCKSMVQIIRWTQKRGIPRSLMAGIMQSACVKFTDKTARVCQGAVETFKDDAVVLLSSSDHAAADICNVFFNICPATNNTRLNWVVSLPPRPVQKEEPKQLVTAVASTPKLRMLHLTDIHIDPMYQVGAAGECDEPQCCRYPAAEPNVLLAGYWGFQGLCDTPKHFLDAMLEHIAKTDKIDFIIWTGDSVPHDVWNQSRNYQTNLTSIVNAAIKKHFPKTPVYATLGNHDSYPVNSFPPPSVQEQYSLAWLYNIIADEWIGWGPNESQRRNILNGAYYAHRPWAGLMIISLNTNYCAKLNWWLMLNIVDPAGEMAWLVYELAESEKLGEGVYIISHISPTGDKCIQTWRDNYFRIMARFKQTIRGTFFGHSHFDEFGVTYDPSNMTQPTSIAYMSPSTTTYRYVNPGYRVFLVDGHHAASQYSLFDFETYVVNLTDANARSLGRPNGIGQLEDVYWQLEYTARQHYSLPDLTPQSWSSLSTRMQTDDGLFMSYYKNHYKKHDWWTKKVCDSECRQALLCKTQANACVADGPTPMY